MNIRNKKIKLKSGVVIATRNRSDKLNKLLLSIYDCSYKPNKIVVVSSGNDVSQITKKYKKLLSITHEHTTETGQVFQRNHGLELLQKENCDIVIFLDDDVIVEKKFFSEIEDFFINKNGCIGGLGFKLKNLNVTKEKENKNISFHKQNNQFGKVLTDGNAVDYGRSEKEIEVEWLNGLSAWKSTVLKEFSHPPIQNSYAACEDLIFSYGVAKKYKLFFCPQITIVNQNSDWLEEEITIEKYKTWWQHKLYFVLVNKELSLNKYILSLIKETIWDLMHINQGNFKKVKLRIIVYLTLLKFIFFKRRELKKEPRLQNYLIQKLL